MHRFAHQSYYRLALRKQLTPTLSSSTISVSSPPRRHTSRHLATVASSPLSPQTVPHLLAADLSYAQKPSHVHQVSQELQRSGMLKVTLGFADNDSRYLELLLHSLHNNHGHQLPISHSATRGWFWDVRPSKTVFQTANHQARSETMQDFPWHTDCSYENPTPRYFALQVLQPDRFGGGTLSIMNVEKLCRLLSPTTRSALLQPEYRITIPTEFIKDPQHTHITGSLLVADEKGQASIMRFREDILAPMSERARRALVELKTALHDAETQALSTVHLTAKDLPERSIILIDNRRWLHARNDVHDPERHLRRVRWDAVPFPSNQN